MVAKYNDTDKVDTGDMDKDWLGKNIKGSWSITVKDTAAISVPPGTPPFVFDGKFNWSVNIQTLSSKKIQIKGDLIVDGGTTATGGLKLGSPTTCDAANAGNLRWDATWGLQACDSQYDNKGAQSYEWIAAAPRKALWSGGCTYQPAGQGGWANYCLDGTDFNTAGDYLAVTNVGAGEITIKKSGFYRFNFFTIQHGCGSKHMRLFINGAQRAYFHNNDTDNAGAWSSHYADLQWPLRKGDVVFLSLNGDSCNPYRWHSWDTGTAHSRLQVEFTGRWHENKTLTF